MNRTEPTLLRRLRMVLILLAILIAFGTGGYMTLEQWSVHDALYMTVITLSTVGYGEVRPLTQAGELFTMLMIFGGVGVLAYSFSTVTDYIVAGELQGYLRRRRTERKIAHMQEHTIICGYGRVGRQVVEELHANEVRLVVIDVNLALAAELEPMGILFVAGDASDNHVLESAGLSPRGRALLMPAQRRHQCLRRPQRTPEAPRCFYSFTLQPAGKPGQAAHRRRRQSHQPLRHHRAPDGNTATLSQRDGFSQRRHPAR